MTAMTVCDSPDCTLASLLAKTGSPVAFLKRNPLDLAKELCVPYQHILRIRQEVCSLILSQPTLSTANHTSHKGSTDRGFKWNQFVCLSETAAHSHLHYTRDPFVIRSACDTINPMPQQFQQWATAAKELMWSNRPTGCIQLNNLFAPSHMKITQPHSPFLDGTHMVGFPNEGGMIRNIHKTRHGLPPGCTVELTGATGSGKSRICYSTIAACALQGMRVLIVDICGSVNLQALHDAMLHSVQAQIMQAESMCSQSGSGSQTQTQTQYTQQGRVVGGTGTGTGTGAAMGYTQLDEQEQQELVLGAMLLVQLTRVYTLHGLLDAMCEVVDAGKGSTAGAGAGLGAGTEVLVYHLVVVDGMSRALAAALPYAPAAAGSPATAAAAAASAADSATHCSAAGGGGLSAVNDRATSAARIATGKLVTAIGAVYRACASLGSTVLVTLDVEKNPAAGKEIRDKAKANGSGDGNISSSAFCASNSSLSLHQGVVGSHTHVGVAFTHGNSTCEVKSTGTGNGAATGAGGARAAGERHVHPDILRTSCTSCLSGIFDISLSAQNLTLTSVNQKYSVDIVSRGISVRHSSTVHISPDGKESVRQAVNPVKAVFTDSMLCYGMA